MSQWETIWSMVWVSPQSQESDGSAPILCKKCLVRPTPERSLFRLTHGLRGRSQPGGLFEGLSMYCRSADVDVSHCLAHLSLSQEGL